MTDLVIRQHIPGEIMVVKVELYDHNMFFTIDRHLRVICFREFKYIGGYNSEIEFNVAYIPYINEMMKRFYNEQD